MVRLLSFVAFAVCAAFLTHPLANAAPARRQLGDLACNINRGEIIFNVAQLAATVESLGNATGLVSANATAEADVQALQTGALGAGGAIKAIALALFTGDTASPDLRAQVGRNLTAVSLALADLSSNDTATTAVLSKAHDQLTNAALAATGVATNCK
ncbi:hypothetical protein BD413DRAFT_612249 [Trametes elegans]|nr:hypothetical protein BD413DRAFT_612249 [Trametes elegans]